MAQKVFQSPAFHSSHHALVHLLQERVVDLVHELGRAAVRREVVRQRSAGEDGHRAVVFFFDGAAHRQAEAPALAQVVPVAPAADADHLVVLVGVHVAHRHQRAVFELQRGVAVRAAFHAHVVGHVGDQVAQRRVARVRVGHVLDEVRQLVAGVGAFECGRAVDVVFAVHEPVHVEHHEGVHAQRAAAPVDFLVAVDRGVAAAEVRARKLRQIHRRHVGDLGGQRELTHGEPPALFSYRDVRLVNHLGVLRHFAAQERRKGSGAAALRGDAALVESRRYVRCDAMPCSTSWFRRFTIASGVAAGASRPFHELDSIGTPCSASVGMLGA